MSAPEKLLDLKEIVLGEPNWRNISKFPLFQSEKNDVSEDQKINHRSLLFTSCTPKVFSSPVMVAASHKAAQRLKIDPSSVSLPSNLPFFTGSTSIKPYCTNYGGYQYGVYYQLGEGRSMNIGSFRDNTIQIRGVGATPFSGGKDGLIPLSSAVYEFLMSETLDRLEIPTVRSIAVVSSSEPCKRGTDKIISHASGLVTRFAPSWIRFGTFDFFHLKGDNQTVKALADHVIEEFYPDAIKEENVEVLVTDNLLESSLFDSDSQNEEGNILAPQEQIELKLKNVGKQISIPLNRYAIFFRRVVERTAILLAHWQANGFVHGLLNTENMSILGLTIQCGSSGFMDTYDPQWSSNSADTDKKYSFENQPAMAEWALARLGQTLVSFLDEVVAPVARLSDDEMEARKRRSSSVPTHRKIPLGFLYNAAKGENIIREIGNEFEPLFCKKLGELLCTKLGLIEHQDIDFEQLINPMLNLLVTTGTDYTTFFRLICSFACSEQKYQHQVTYQPEGIHAKDALLVKTSTDCLCLLLKSLLLSQEREEQVCRAAIYSVIPTEGESKRETFMRRKNSNGNSEIAPIVWPSLQEVAKEWKAWASVYRTRLISHMNPNKKTPEAIFEEDIRRAKRLKTINPKFALRSSIMKDVLEKVEKETQTSSEKKS